ncbi:hypothetical protein VPH35_104311 [Triticum aestivum]
MKAVGPCLLTRAGYSLIIKYLALSCIGVEYHRGKRLQKYHCNAWEWSLTMGNHPATARELLVAPQAAMPCRLCHLSAMASRCSKLIVWCSVILCPLRS